MLKYTDVFCGDLADVLLGSYKDNYTYCHPSPPPELAQDLATCLPMTFTPNRTQNSARSLWSGMAPYRDAYPLITSTPRSLITPSTPSLPATNVQTLFSPSPLPLSQVPSLVFPEISPPSQGSGSTPFERQFVGDFSREWNNIDTQISPVSRGNFHSALFSPAYSNAAGNPFRTEYELASRDSHDAVGRVSLIEKFISAAAHESAITENDVSSQGRSSPLSDLSDLTPLSSPKSSSRGLDSRNSPPTSPTVERPCKSRHSRLEDAPDSGRDPPSGPSTRSSSRSLDSDYRPAKGATGRKRKNPLLSRDGDDTSIKHKKTRLASVTDSTSTDIDSTLEKSSRRILPTNIPYHPQFALFYLRFPVSSYLRLADETFPLLPAGSKRVAGIYNEPRGALDLYTPRFVRGCGATKVGVCPICIESPSRGGKGEVVWLSMKFSAYKWHVSDDSAFTPPIDAIPLTESCYPPYSHGISSVSARPFSPPVAFRTTERSNPTKNERTSIQEGKCHRCKKWIPVESVKNIDIKVEELYWWKHAATCHQGNHIEGDDDFFIDDEIYRHVQQLSDSDP